jgi:hypothetical protein
MEQIDPHLEILLQEFVRLSPEDAPLEQDTWTGLYEICLFAYEQEMMPPAWTIRDYFVTHGCSLRKATFLSPACRGAFTPALPIFFGEYF